ncbi:hypothetical protein [Sediminibacterium sp.]|jgi:hypothetical protein|uniref:hypothetical protein n=1 Tax=Sediminibacterium sp. TaxID=1917865 RepID=UPI0025FEE1BB|nr:hypothetical protein [Sediminibacterium sp.]MBW0176896.1 hypothetical protein [Sediminibacterium sp.]
MLNKLLLHSLYTKLFKSNYYENASEISHEIRYEVHFSIPVYFKARIFHDTITYSNLMILQGTHCKIEYLYIHRQLLPDFEVVIDTPPANIPYMVRMDIFVDDKRLVSHETFQNKSTGPAFFSIEASKYTTRKIKTASSPKKPILQPDFTRRLAH